MMKAVNRRIAPRKHIVGIHVKNLTSLEPLSLMARKAVLVDASSTGVLLHIDRKDFVPKKLRQNLTIQSIEGEHVMFEIAEMDLEIDGRISRTRLIGKGVFEVAVDYSEEAPEYWRECLYELLPDEDLD